ncbi:MAG: hypothetical protein RLZZ303_3783 [Candidatus Hydrogenedentota bacterium]|jgi:arylsulfatase A-like enzyme/endonuclease/exonuclease/phosphatase family metal-dependent hydrolase
MLRKLMIAVFVTACLLGAIFLYLYANTFSNGWTGVPGDFASSALLGEARPLSKPVTLRAVTFNIQDLYLVARDHEARMQAIARKLGTLDPDIVGFQEAFIEKHRSLLIDELRKHTRLQHFQYYPSAKMGSGLLTASAYPIEEAWFHRFTVSNPWWKVWEGDYWAGKGAGLARIALPDGAGYLDFFNTHAQASYGVEANRQICAVQMGEFGAFIRDARLPGAPALAVGDLNTRIGSDGFNNLVANAGVFRVMNMDSAIDQLLAVNDPGYDIEVLDTIKIEERVVSDGREFDLSDHPGYLSEIRISPRVVESAESDEAAAAPKRPNVLLVVIDTLRGDRVDAKRNGMPVMPHLREYAAGGAWFKRALSPATWTKPSVASILTGLFPETHGVQYGVQRAWFEGQDMSVTQTLKPGTPTIATLLKSQGYRTGCIQTNQHVTQAMGFGEGVDQFEFYFAQPAGLITDKALGFIGAAEGPWFLYAHYIDPHAGYNPPEPHRSAFGPLPALTDEETEWLKDENYHTGYYMDRFKYDVDFIQERQYGEFSETAREAIRQLYDGECLYTDAELKRLLDVVERDHLDTLVIITSDHGEEFWEHGSIGHGKTVYEELAHVPLIVRGPGVAPEAIETPALTLDIGPTIAGYLGLDFHPGAQGVNLLARSPEPRPVYTSTRGSIPEFKLDAASVLAWPLKLIDDRKRGTTRLFDLAQDPREQADLSGERPDEAARLLAALGAHRSAVSRDDAANTTALSREELEALESLGYVDAAAGGEAPEN